MGRKSPIAPQGIEGSVCVILPFEMEVFGAAFSKSCEGDCGAASQP